jgi:integrase
MLRGTGYRNLEGQNAGLHPRSAQALHGYGGDKPFQARWRHPTQRGVKRERSFATKKEARQWMSDQDTDATRGTWTDPWESRRMFANVAAEWQASRLKSGPKTRTGHDSILARHLQPAFGLQRIDTIDAYTIQKWVNGLAATHAPNTVHNVYAVLKLVMAYAVRHRYLAVNPCADVERPSKRRRITIRPLTHGEVQLLAGAMPNDRARLAVLTSVYMGLRAGELWALRRDDVNVLKRELTVDEAIKELPAKQTDQLPEGHVRLTPSLIIGPTKTHATRKLSMPAFLADELAALISESAEFIFTDSAGGPIRHGNFYKRVFLANLPAKLKGTRWHDLRHTRASLLIEQGHREIEIMRRMGHEDIRTTLNTYGHLFPAAEESMAASMDAAFRAARDAAPAVVELRSQQ